MNVADLPPFPKGSRATTIANHLLYGEGVQTPPDQGFSHRATHFLQSTQEPPVPTIPKLIQKSSKIFPKALKMDLIIKEVPCYICTHVLSLRQFHDRTVTIRPPIEDSTLCCFLTVRQRKERQWQKILHKYFYLIRDLKQPHY